MKRAVLFIPLLILAVFLAANANAMLIQDCYNTTYLKDNSDLVVIAKIVSVQDRLENTDVLLNVQKYIKGKGSDTFKILVLGGETVKVEDQPIFTTNTIGKKFKFYLKTGITNPVLICGAQGVKQLEAECLENSDCPSTKCLGGEAKCVNQACVETRCGLEEEINLPSAGALPGSWEYKYKIWWEGIKARLIIKSENKEMYKLKIMEKRLAEANELIKKNLTEKSVEMIKESEAKLKDIQTNSDKLKALGKNVTILEQHIANTTYKHVIVLQNVLQRVPENAKSAIEHAINVSQNGYENALEHLQERNQEQNREQKGNTCSINGKSMTLEEAEAIAMNSECNQGNLEDDFSCNSYTGTWWINLDIEKAGCNPACVINVQTKQAEINWRCTGLIEKECTTESDCGIGGCGGEICTTAKEAPSIVTACVYKEEFSCLRKTTCSCIEGKCEWRKDLAAYTGCIDLLEKGQPSECKTNADCVANSCCHPTSCVVKAKAPECIGTTCTTICMPNTLDCGAGSCACIEGKCAVQKS